MSNFQNTTHTLPIVTLFDDAAGDSVTALYYREVILRTLKKILPETFFQPQKTEEATRKHRQKIFAESIPFIKSSEAPSLPGNMSFFALSKYRQSSFKFFFEMISRWLIPGQRLDVVLVYASDFCLPELSDEIYTICEVVIRLEEPREIKDIQYYFPLLQTEIALGIQSAFYARRILEVKGLSADEKTASIQEFIALLVKRFPKIYDYDVFSEMQHVLVMCRDEFKAVRQSRHLSRIISLHYLYRKSILGSIKKNSQRRHVRLKIFRAVVQTINGPKRVLGLLVGMNFIREQEVFGEKNFLRAIQQTVRSAQLVDQSCFINKRGSEQICTIYLEIEKKDGSDFTSEEFRKLRRELPADLKNRIEQRLHPIFMPRNEEEIMRNILVLSNQIRYVRDIPQVFISFDEQAHSHLSFTVVLARVLKPGSKSISEMFQKTPTFMEYVHDRTKIMGYIRKKYAKEATVFRLNLPKEIFLRADHSIDLYKARQTLVSELSQVIGEVRDYNGGMMFKQHQLLSVIRNLLVEEGKYDELLLENFFYSLSPVVIRALLDPQAFKTLFLMLLEGLKAYKQEGYYLKFHKEPYNIFVIAICDDQKMKDHLNQAVERLQIPSTEIASAYIKANGHPCMGYICCAREVQKKELLFNTIQTCLEKWEARAVKV